MLRFEEQRYDKYIIIKSYLDNKYVSRIEFIVRFNIPHLDIIYVEKEYRRKGIATQMLKYLQKTYNKDIIWGGKTKEGEQLYKSFYGI
jgi:GNAT superfamily N-acetyltransferase